MKTQLFVALCLAACVRSGPTPPTKDPAPMVGPVSAPALAPASAPLLAAPVSVPIIATPLPLPAPKPIEPPAPPRPKSEEVAIGQVVGNVQTSRYFCGGMEPDDDLKQKLATPKPEIGLTLLFRKGTNNNTKAKISAEVKTDKDGNFTVKKLAPGTYCIVEEPKRKNGPLPKMGALVADKTCYAAWLATCDVTLTLGKEHGEFLEIKRWRGCEDPVCVDMPKRPAAQN